MIITDGGEYPMQGLGCRAMKVLSGTSHMGIFKENSFYSIVELYGMRFIDLHRGSETGRNNHYGLPGRSCRQACGISTSKLMHSDVVIC